MRSSVRSRVPVGTLPVMATAAGAASMRRVQSRTASASTASSAASHSAPLRTRPSANRSSAAVSSRCCAPSRWRTARTAIWLRARSRSVSLTRSACACSSATISSWQASRCSAVVEASSTNCPARSDWSVEQPA